MKRSVYSLIVMLCITSAAFSQGFMVKPMRLDLTLQPGKTYNVPIELTNTTSDQTIQLEIQPYDMVQGANASWKVVTAEEMEAQGYTHNSCLPWLSTENQNLSVQPLETIEETLSIRIPRNARGVYTAALIAQTLRDPNAEGLAMQLRFVIPITIATEGAPARKKLDLTDVDLIYRPNQSGNESKDIVVVSFNNSGQTNADVSGTVAISKKSGERWRQITTMDMPRAKIIAGMSVPFELETPRRLASGQYRLDARMEVDGRPIKPIRKEIDYAGDPSISNVASDVELEIAPTALEIDCTRTPSGRGVYTLTNHSEEVLSIQLAVIQPEGLKGVAIGPVLGDHFSAHEWVALSPNFFTLRPGGQQRVMVNASYPEQDHKKPYHFASLLVDAKFADGQQAGTLHSIVTIKNENHPETPRISSIDVGIAQEERHQYAIKARYGNIGTNKIDPNCVCKLMNASGTSTAGMCEMSIDKKTVLPLTIFSFNGLLDIAGISPGAYMLNISVSHGGGSDVQKIPVEIVEEDGTKTLKRLETSS